MLSVSELFLVNNHINIHNKMIDENAFKLSNIIQKIIL